MMNNPVEKYKLFKTKILISVKTKWAMNIYNQGNNDLKY